jgi:glycolate oxidase
MLVDVNRMCRILEIDVENRCALVEPAVLNLDLSTAVARHGLFYAPDPSSQKASTIGGNIAENAGGPHCLSRGVTTNHVLAVEAVTGEGDLAWLGGRCADAPGYDLTGLFVGSEGMFGVATRAWVRLCSLPQHTVTLMACFDTVEASGAAVSAIIARGVIPSALELIDGPSAEALERAFHAGYPPGVGAVLLIDVDGLPESVDEEAPLVREVCETAPGSISVKFAATQAERDALWAARKGALAACAMIAPNYYLCDGVVPRTRLAEVLRRVYAVVEDENVIVASVAHVGDGNLHPLILFDAREPGIMDRVHRAADRVIRACVDAGGTISGEHGVGLEKREYMHWIFSGDDMDRMKRVHAAFDPGGRFNPGKVFPDAEPAHHDRAMAGVGATAAASQEHWI